MCQIGCMIRWMIRRDMDEVLRIENDVFEFPWKLEHFITSLRQRNCIGMTAEINDQIAGYMLYELHKNRLHIVNFAVARKFQRSGIGTQMISKLKAKLSHQRRSRIQTEVRETNMPALLFFKTNGFRATAVIGGHYEDTDEDAYLMHYRHRPLPADILPFQIQNRMNRRAG